MTARRRRFFSLPLLIVSVALIFVFYQARRAQDIASALGAALRHRDELRHQLHRAEVRLAEAERERIKPAALTSAQMADSEGNVTAGRTETPAEKQRRQAYTTIANDPTLRAEYLKCAVAQAITNYGPKVWVLKLTPEQREKVIGYNVEREAARLDLIASVSTQGLTMNDPVFKKIEARLDDEVTQKTNALLGPSDAAIWRAIGKNYVFQNTADYVAEAVYLTSTPLTLAQEQELVRIMAGDRERRARDGSQYSIDTVAAQASAAGIPPAQVVALRTRLAQELANRQMQQMIDSAANRFPAGSRPTINIETPTLPPRKS